MNAKLFVKKYGAPISFGFSMLGLLGTVACAIHDTVKAVNKLNEIKQEKENPLTKKEIFKATWKCYIPTMLSLAATATCSTCSFIASEQRIKGITGAYAVVCNELLQYKSAIDEMHKNGEEITNESIREKIVKENPIDISDYTVLPDGSCLYYDEISQRYFNRLPQEVRDAEYYLNRNFQLRGDASLNEFYDLLGLDHVPYGDDVGWSIDAGVEFYGYSWIDFTHELVKFDDGMECYVIHMPFEPTLDYSIAGYSIDHGGKHYSHCKPHDIDPIQEKYKAACKEAREAKEKE